MTLQPTARPELNGPFPEHIAVIMDGNGRWAQKQGMRRIFGHREGITSVREITTECASMGVGSLTLYAFSVENWKRPRAEVRYLMRLLRRFLVDERPTLMKNDVRLRGIGRLEDLPGEALGELRRTEAMTAENRGMTLRLALSYGGRTELADAARQLAEDVAAGRRTPESIDEESLREYLYDPSTPDPDLLIRTAGEMRLSNFLLWQLSYSELYVSDRCWPEFRKADLLRALEDYASRTRTYGGLIADLPEPALRSAAAKSASTGKSA
ncbi:MAG: isoprenyl transferase [Planctomycetota bacterium]